MELLQQQKLEITQNAARESSISRAEQLQSCLNQGSRHQQEMAEETRKLAKRCLTLTMQLVEQVDNLFKKPENSDDSLTPRQKSLLVFTPNLIKATATLITTSKESWDRAFGVEEIAKRLGEWQARWDEGNRN